jgi:hypothetical protein
LIEGDWSEEPAGRASEKVLTEKNGQRRQRVKNEEIVGLK